MMNEENIKTEDKKKNADRYSTLSAKLKSVHLTLTQASSKPGISSDLVTRINDQIRRHAEIQAAAQAQWKEIQRTQRTETSDDTFDKVESEVEELLLMGRELHVLAVEESEYTEKAKTIIYTDKSEFIKARNHHRLFPNITLGLLLLVMVFGIVFIALFFTSTSHIETGEGVSGWLGGIVLFGGRISMIIGIGWVFKHLSSLQRSHSQQAVSYQDRLAGLDTAELILTKANMPTRTEILKQMTETYLTLKQNAFKAESVPKEKHEEAEKRLFEKCLGMVGDMLKIVRGQGE